MPRYLRFVLLAIGFIPYACKLPYMWRAWGNSPQDQFDWIFVLSFTILFPLVWIKTRKRREVAVVDWTVLIVLLPALGGYLAGIYLGINALQILAGILFSFSVFWLIYGGQNAYRVLPTFAILALGTTSTTHWINYYTGSPEMMAGFWIKLAALGILLIWLAANFFKEKKVETQSLLFAGALCLSLLFIWQSNDASSQKGRSVLLELSTGKTGAYLGQSQVVTENDVRFFGEDSEISKYYYIAEREGIYVLAITCGGKINSIHPASHCLRSSGWSILSEDIIQTEIQGEVVFMNQIIAEQGGVSFLFWVWYTNQNESTGSFVHFRKDWRADETWNTYQLMIPMDRQNPLGTQAAQRQLVQFIEAVSR